MLDTSVLTEQADLQMVVSGIRELSFVDQKHLFLMGCSQGGMVSAMEVADHPHDYADTFIAIRWCSPKMLWKVLGWRRTDAGQDPLELHDVFFDATDDVNESLIVLPGWIWQIPIIVESLADIGASHVAAHGNRDIRFWNIRNQFGVLRFLHIDAVKLSHESYGILIDLRLGFRTCGIKIKIGSA